MMFRAVSSSTNGDESKAERVIQYRVENGSETLSFKRVIQLWKEQQEFRSFFSECLASCPFTGFRWETPGLLKANLEAPFEFVLVNFPSFGSRPTDQVTFQEYFTDNDENHGVVSFLSLRKDSELIVPSPRTQSEAYGHLAAFVRLAPKKQIDALWKVVGDRVEKRIGDRPLWLNTAGGGVAWLHVRLDSAPKYYCHLPYKSKVDV